MKVQWEHRGPGGWGRFGGGWQWAIGFRAGGSTLIIELLVGYLRIDWRQKR